MSRSHARLQRKILVGWVGPILWALDNKYNMILVIYTYITVQTESLDATASVALPPERLPGMIHLLDLYSVWFTEPFVGAVSSCIALRASTLLPPTDA
jgi:hypothetical protein